MTQTAPTRQAHEVMRTRCERLERENDALRLRQEHLLEHIQRLTKTIHPKGTV